MIVADRMKRKHEGTGRGEGENKDRECGNRARQRKWEMKRKKIDILWCDRMDKECLSLEGLKKEWVSVSESIQDRQETVVWGWGRTVKSVKLK